jgi:hypothetical protein
MRGQFKWYTQEIVAGVVASSQYGLGGTLKETFVIKRNRKSELDMVWGTIYRHG